MKKKTALTKMHIAPSTVRYDAVAARDSNEVGLILAAVRKRNRSEEHTSELQSQR